MKNILLTTSTMILSFTTLNAQQFEWAKSVGSTSIDQGISIYTEDTGDIFVAGGFSGTVDFDPGPGVHNLTTSGTGIFVQKLDQNGNFISALDISTSNVCYLSDFKLDTEGNMYLAGQFTGTVDFDPGPGYFNVTAQGAGGFFDRDIFMLKLDVNGVFLWVNTFGDVDYDAPSAFVLDEDNNILLTGCFEGNVDFDPGVGTFSLNSNGVQDLFVLKMDSDGNFLWAKTTGGTGDDRGHSISIDSNKNIFITGKFEGTVDFDFGIGTNNLTSNGSSDMYIMKLDSIGEFAWAHSFGNSSFDIGYAVEVDEDGNVYTTGNFQYNIDFDPGLGTHYLYSSGQTDVFALKLDNSGNFSWAKSFGGSSYDYGYHLTIDSANDIYVSGAFSASVDFDPGVAEYYQNSNGANDMYIQKLDSSGNFLWARTAGGAQNDQVTKVTVDLNGNIYSTGNFESSVDFNTDLDSNTHFLTSNGSFDVFVHKMSQCYIVNTTTLVDATITSDAVGANYQWIDCDDNNEPLTGATNQSFTATQNGNYAVIVSNGGSCVDTSECIAITTLNTGSQENWQKNLSIYPNPVADHFTLDIDEKIISIEVRDVSGKIETRLSEETEIINTSALPNGIYILKVYTDTGAYTQRFVKL